MTDDVHISAAAMRAYRIMKPEGQNATTDPEDFDKAIAELLAIADALRPARSKPMTDDELDALAHLVKPLEWSERMVFGTRKWRGRGQFGEFASFSGNDLTEEQVAAEKAEIESDYTRRILSALNLDALRSPPAYVGEAARVLLAIENRKAVHSACEGHSKVYKFDAVLRALAETTKGDAENASEVPEG
jgi:hypothetical protein